MKLKPAQKNVLSAIAIVCGGFILFNVAFLLAAATMQLYRLVSRLFGANDAMVAEQMYWKYVFVLLVLLISWFVLRSKLNVMLKATYFTMPLMVALIVSGIQFYEQPLWVPICIGAAIVAVCIITFYKMKLAWQYYFATFYTAALALIVVLAGIEI